MRTPLLAIAACLMLAGTSFAAETAIAWGYNNHGQCNVPAGETFVQVAAGEYHTIGLRADGTAIACGLNSDGQCNVPAGETFVQVAAGSAHNVGLRKDGTAIAWGHNNNGQCDVPSGETFAQVDGGGFHTIGLRADGTAIAWGHNDYGQCDVPAGETFVQVACGSFRTIGLREDGTAIAWGYNGYGDVPVGETFVQVAAGLNHNIGVREDGTAIAWGDNEYGQCDVPSGETFAQVACGGWHTLGLRADGSVIAWGRNIYGQCDVPAGETFVQVACGTYHSIGLRSQQDSDGDGVPDDIDNCYLYNPDQADCNGNGIGDVCDVADQTSFDCNQNIIPDECESDCDGDGIIDDCDNNPDIDGDGIPDNCEEDCNGNSLPDDWEIKLGLVTDCNGNLVPDECDLIEQGTIANINIIDSGRDYPTEKTIPLLVADPFSSGGSGFEGFATTMAGGNPGEVVGIKVPFGGSGYEPNTIIGLMAWSPDGKTAIALAYVGSDGIVQNEGSKNPPVIAESGSGFIDTPSWQVVQGGKCDKPAVFQAVLHGGIDETVIINGGEGYFVGVQIVIDTNSTGVNAVLESDIEPNEDYFSSDCNENSLPDECELADGTADDLDGNGIIDECECFGDISDGTTPGATDGLVNVNDLLAVIGFWGSDGPIGDINFDGTVGVDDLLTIIANWGPCP